MFSSPGEDSTNLNDSSPEVDKRLAMYKRMRAELNDEAGKQSQLDQDKKMQEISSKIDKLEASKREKA